MKKQPSLEHSGVAPLLNVSEDEMSRIGADLAMALQPGDALFLSGDLGAGKSTLARSIIRSLAEDDDLEVPSPTYTVCQSYNARFPIHHFDLYRLSDPEEIEELAALELLEEGAILVEWPENCFPTDPEQALRITININPDDTRTLVFQGNPDLASRVGRSFLIRGFLAKNSLENTERRFLAGDASARAYELVDQGRQILMNAPAMPDGPPVRDGKPYSKIAHLAEDISAFIAIDKLLIGLGIRAPRIFDHNLSAGLLLTENLGTNGIVDTNRKPIAERYRSAVEVLAHLHVQEMSKDIPFAEGKAHRIQNYDRDALMMELELLLDWFVPDQGLEEFDRSDFIAIWEVLISEIQTHPKCLVLRDYHSPNILWLPEESGLDQVGVIDFQDAVIGPHSYDVASLAQDARIDITEELEAEILAHYIALRLEKDPHFDDKQFREGYAIMAAQRATKILGIFVRLDLRDGKPGYRTHIPRIIDYLKRSLRHPILSEYKAWLENVVKL